MTQQMFLSFGFVRIILDALGYIFIRPWKRTAFWLAPIYGLFMVTCFCFAFTYQLGYLLGNLRGISEPLVGLPYAPIPLGFLFPNVYLTHLPGSPALLWVWLVWQGFWLTIFALSFLALPPEGLAGGRVGRLPYIMFHLSYFIIILSCFVQYQFPKPLFGLLGS